MYLSENFRSGVFTENDWYPPGHGNFYKAFSDSGLLELFIGEGKLII